MAYKTIFVYNVDQSVGQGGANQSADVQLVQAMLNELARVRTDWAPRTPLPVNGSAAPPLVEWIKAFQTQCAKKNPGRIVIDGRIDPMHMTQSHDWSHSFGGNVASTMFMLNMAVHRNARQAYEAVGQRLGIQEKGWAGDV